MATPSTRTHLLTAEEFYELPDPPHGGKMELIDGTVVVHMPVGRPHGRIAVRLGALLLPFADQHDLGEVHAEVGHRVQHGPDTVLAPDVSFSDWNRLEQTAQAGFIDLGPTLALEVLSPGDTRREVADKVRRYFAGQVERVWIVDPERSSVTVYRNTDNAVTHAGDATLSSDDAGFAADGFSLRVADIFR